MYLFSHIACTEIFPSWNCSSTTKIFTFINLFFTTKLHLNNPVTKGSSNKLPGVQISLNHEWEGLLIAFICAFSFQPHFSVRGTNWFGRGSPWGGSCCGPGCSSSAVGCTERAQISLPPLGGGHILCLFSSGSGFARCWGEDFCISPMWAYVGPSLPMWIDHSEKWHDGDSCAVGSIGVFECLRRELAGAWFPFSPLTMSFF